MALRPEFSEQRRGGAEGEREPSAPEEQANNRTAEHLIPWRSWRLGGSAETAEAERTMIYVAGMRGRVLCSENSGRRAIEALPTV